MILFSLTLLINYVLVSLYVLLTMFLLPLKFKQKATSTDNIFLLCLIRPNTEGKPMVKDGYGTPFTKKSQLHIINMNS